MPWRPKGRQKVFEVKPVADRLRVLIVEDSALIRDNLRAMLEQLGSIDVVAQAAGERDACMWMDARNQACDVVMVDIFLSEGSGFGVLKHLATYEKPPEAVVLTNNATDDLCRRCIALGAKACFDKSNQVEKLVAWFEQRIAERTSDSQPLRR